MSRISMCLSSVALAAVLLAPAMAQDPALKAIDQFIKESRIDREKPDWKTRLPKPPEVKFTEGAAYRWHLETNRGSFTIDFMPGHAPYHVSSAIFLTRVGFYDGLTFHRIIPGFMAQGGCPLGTGTGGPGYSFGGEHHKDVRHDTKGVLSTANTGQPNTDSSQFFLTFAPTPHLDGKHTIYGRVSSGQEIVDAIAALGTSSGRTKSKVVITKATVSVGKPGDGGATSGPPAGVEKAPDALPGAPLEALRKHIEGVKIDRSKEDWRQTLPKAPLFSFEARSRLQLEVETSVGKMRFRLSPADAPRNVSNLMYLSELGFYDGLALHRILPGFVAQGGCPNQDGTKGPGYAIPTESSEGRRHDARGTLSMVGSSNGKFCSQFFIAFRLSPKLDGEHTVVGKIAKGLPTLRKIEKAGQRSGAPTKKITIEKMRVVQR